MSGDHTARTPLVIAHRGASGYRPEHTLAAYRLAIEQGADFIEPDLVATADGVLIARHENALAILGEDGAIDRCDTSTDVYERPAYADRLAIKTIDGRTVRGWFSEDFSLAEIRTLRAVERIPALRPDNARFDGAEPVPTLGDILDLVRATEATTGRHVGIYPETKHPSYFAREGQRLEGGPISIDLGARLIAELAAAGFTDPRRVFIQSFEVGNLQRLHDEILPAAGFALPLIQLVERDGAPRDWASGGDSRGYADLVTPAGLAFVARYAAGLGVHKDWIVPRAPTGEFGAPSRLIADAHAAGLLVHAWTFRAENHFLPPALRRGMLPAGRGDLAAEIAQFARLGVDGLFSDHPDLARRAVSALAR